MADEIDLTKIEKELALQNDLKIFELKLFLYLRKENHDMDNKEYNNFKKALNGFRKS